MVKDYLISKSEAKIVDDYVACPVCGGKARVVYVTFVLSSICVNIILCSLYKS